ncbi:MAG: hypothetical protein IPJ25_07320 [Rhodocyclaceae bacterium]|nr:hypothetical protein [Rhodocyclaceae bacterium]
MNTRLRNAHLATDSPFAMQHNSVPAFLSIDVEPDAFQLSRNEAPAWAAFDAMVPFIEKLRADLAVHNGASPVFGWYIRTDPQIAEAYGHADHGLHFYADRIAGFRSVGDYIGVHVHPLRWSESHQAWIHDFSDRQWLYDCTLSSLEGFAKAVGAPARHMRYGGGFLSNEIVDLAEAHGAVIDLTLEPVASWALHTTVFPTSIDTSPIVGSFVNCEGAPREPYQPDRDEFRVCRAYGRRTIVLLPLSSVLASNQPDELPTAHMLYPSVPWPSPDFFWDLVWQQLRSMERPYLSLAIRTDAQEVKRTAEMRKIFEALPGHPIAKHLRWVDPLEAIDSLVSS